MRLVRDPGDGLEGHSEIAHLSQDAEKGGLVDYGTGEEGAAPVIPDEDAVPEALRPIIAQEALEPYLIVHGASIGPESSTSRLRSRSREKSSPSR